MNCSNSVIILITQDKIPITFLQDTRENYGNTSSVGSAFQDIKPVSTVRKAVAVQSLVNLASGVSTVASRMCMYLFCLSTDLGSHLGSILSTFYDRSYSATSLHSMFAKHDISEAFSLRYYTVLIFLITILIFLIALLAILNEICDD